jgi:hypothetical protein
MQKFIKGLELNRSFYKEIVAPLLKEHFPDLKYSASLIGYGSDVLGYDTERSMDHNWGPRMQIFLSEADFKEMKGPVDSCLKWNLPFTFKGFPVNFTKPSESDGVQHMNLKEEYPINHLIEIDTVSGYLDKYLGVGTLENLQLKGWLVFTEQNLLELVAGEVFHDGLDELNTMREKLQYLPKDILLFKMAAQWMKISSQQAFIGRCNSIEDFAGMKIVTTQLIKNIMKLCFMMEQKYIPYDKWLGTAFRELEIGKKLQNNIDSVLSENEYCKIERILSEIYLTIADKHNSLKMTPFIKPEVTDFYNRPYKVLFAGKYAEALLGVISSDEIRKLRVEVGGIDQLSEMSDAIEDPGFNKVFESIYTDIYKWEKK